MRLTDADKLIQSWKDELWYKEHKDHKCGDVTWGTVYDAFIADAEHAPTAEERKTGRWIDGHCSICGCDVPAYIIDWRWQKDMDARYCPHCGAKMEVEDEQTG